MKNVAHIIVLLLVGCALTAEAQFRGTEPQKPDASDGVFRASPNAILGILDPERFDMKHSVSMSYSSFGSQSLGMSMYTNSIRYKIADPLQVRADVSMMYSPFNSLPASMQDNINGIYLSRASLDYRPSEDVHISVQYRSLPGVYSPYGYGGYGIGLSPFDTRSGFFGDE